MIRALSRNTLFVGAIYGALGGLVGGMLPVASHYGDWPFELVADWVGAVIAAPIALGFLLLSVLRGDFAMERTTDPTAEEGET